MLSLQNGQLRTTLPDIKLPANSEAVKVSPQTRQEHNRFSILLLLLADISEIDKGAFQAPAQAASKVAGSTDLGMVTRREVLSRAEISHSYVVETPKGVTGKKIHIKETAMQGTQVIPKPSTRM